MKKVKKLPNHSEFKMHVALGCAPLPTTDHSQGQPTLPFFILAFDTNYPDAPLLEVEQLENHGYDYAACQQALLSTMGEAFIDIHLKPGIFLLSLHYF